MPAAPGRSWWPIAMVAASIATFASLSLLLQRASGPVLFTDEAGYLGMANELAGRAGDVDLSGNPYYSPGLSVLLAGVLRVTDLDAYTAGVLVNIAALGLLAGILYVLARRALGAGNWAAATAAIAGSTIPGLGINLTRVWPEVLLAFLTALWALVLHEFLRHRSLLGALGLAGTAGILWVTHHRAIAAVGLTVVVLVVVPVSAGISARRHGEGSDRRHRRVVAVALIALALLVLGLLAARAFEDAIRTELYGGGSTRQQAERVLSRAWSSGSWRRVLGHLWTTQVVTLGLAGVCVQAITARRADAVTRLWLGLVTVAFVGSIAVSSAFLANQTRVDTIVYERYIGVYFPVFVAAGVVLFVRLEAARAAFARRSIVATGVVYLIMVSVLGAAAFRGSTVNPTIPTLVGWDLLGGDRSPLGSKVLDVGVITVAVVLVALALTALYRRYRVPAAAGLPLVFLAVTLAAAHWSFGPSYNAFETAGANAADLFAAEGVDTFGVAPGTGAQIRNTVQYASGYLPTVPVDPAVCPSTQFFVAPDGFEPGFASARVLDLVPFGGGVWETSCVPEA